MLARKRQPLVACKMAARTVENGGHGRCLGNCLAEYCSFFLLTYKIVELLFYQKLIN